MGAILGQDQSCILHKANIVTIMFLVAAAVVLVIVSAESVQVDGPGIERKPQAHDLALASPLPRATRAAPPANSLASPLPPPIPAAAG